MAVLAAGATLFVLLSGGLATGDEWPGPEERAERELDALLR